MNLMSNNINTTLKYSNKLRTTYGLLQFMLDEALGTTTGALVSIGSCT